KNKKIENFFKKDKLPEELIKSITIFLKKWVKVFSKQNKNYISIAVGCTGGKHRSVYIAEKLGENFKKIKNYKVLIKHRDI
ncbi:MAG: RNase adapter RapZ, partial [Pseudomonadota bacterium]|nr:RNase adapter RapZ [Pseudomonadota bacterium]